MTFDYFTPGDAEQYAYYSIPKMLIKGEQFRGISMEAKLLYTFFQGITAKESIAVVFFWSGKRSKKKASGPLDHPPPKSLT